MLSLLALCQLRKIRRMRRALNSQSLKLSVLGRLLNFQDGVVVDRGGQFYRGVVDVFGDLRLIFILYNLGILAAFFYDCKRLLLLLGKWDGEAAVGISIPRTALVSTAPRSRILVVVR